MSRYVEDDCSVIEYLFLTFYSVFLSFWQKFMVLVLILKYMMNMATSPQHFISTANTMLRLVISHLSTACTLHEVCEIVTFCMHVLL